MDPDGIDALHSLTEKIEELMEFLKDIAEGIVASRKRW